ncbi:CHASE2 domain-containing protein [Candidatus Woesearchaeota archaeon]|jgi:adenylate cyclase|nr:CHASE2 domain-containing protein [Candidatus Woesearchaeota archaeon]MBT6519603.1 CHASE2 domain-containing protein [Candidatus Woesearchaeota archaeon]MBT7367518.1 CHASE2 domain-containing protein [Candidatus Woesearchaeota archaeon]
MKKINPKKCVLISVFCSIILFAFFYVGLFSNIQLKISDNLYGGKTPLDAIILVEIDDSSIQEIGRWPWDRSVFAELINKLNQSKVIGVDVSFFESSDPAQDKLLRDSIISSNVVLPMEFTSFSKENNKIIGQRFLQPINELSSAKTGYVNILTDRDGTTRAVNLDLSKNHKSFAQVVYEEFWNKQLEENPYRFLINFMGEPGSFKSYSVKDVISGSITPEEFKNKLVLVGATSPDLHDDYFVPTSNGKAMSGVEIHANTIQTMINKDFLTAQPVWCVFLSMLAVSLIIAFVFIFAGITVAAVTSFILILAYLFFTIYAFDYGMILNLVFIPVSILVTFGSETIYFYFTEKRAKIELKNAFSKYVSHKVVNELMQDPKKLALGGSRREITVFFSDIRGFTTISENLGATRLVKVLNEYLTEMTDIVLNHDGVVDKFIGDAVMAFWGAPLDQPDHAVMACNTSIDMMKKLAELQKGWTKRGFPEIKIGIGLNTGHAVIGNMGSNNRFDYTAIGDSINLGARLESLTKQYGVDIIISEFTKKKIDKSKTKFITRKLDLVKVKGKNKPVTIYELAGRSNEVSNKKLDLIKHYETAIEFYLKKKWDKAINEFKNAIKNSDSGDKASEEFIKRCKSFKRSPPVRGWDGVWVMKTK